MNVPFLLISDRDLDREFTHLVAQKCKASVIEIKNRNSLVENLMESRRSLIFWDVDHPSADDPNDSFSVHNVGQVLAEFSSPSNIFALSSRALSDLPYLSNRIFFGHFFLRRYNRGSIEILTKIAEIVTSKLEPFGLQNFVDAGTQITKIQISNTAHKKAAVEAIHKVLQKKNIPSRLAALISQGTDELLLHTIFGSKPNRAKADFNLGPDKQVILELAVGSTYLAIGVTDRLGLLHRETVQNFIRKDYRKVQYEALNDQIAAGIGIYGLIKSGLSTIFISDKKLQNQSILMAPLIKNFRMFRNSFQFFSFLLD